ncbi:tyrosine-type recombinase/integrase [Nostoc sp. MS1]|uniref:tyrosine-type recombinase/integrase n=1 Tax=Nostoc sp. MS1 TaxID=2764711 RepID=UPI001CC7A934|nr:tyrosine-type recombinase/integrase [Nostoc sp. MS1]BCL38352.1 hypothetical protein NSMS1_47990 [Nostoc sp. MS1]
MYLKQAKNIPIAADVRVGTDKGSLRLQFSSRISQKFYQKKQAYKGLGRSDTTENRQWADGIARRIQADIDHPDGLFDPTLVKYLEVKAMTSVIQLPTAKPLPKLGELWDDFSQWKYRTKQIAETTYLKKYCISYKHVLSSYLDKELTEETANSLIEDMVNRTKGKEVVKILLCLLSQLCQKNGITDYFYEVKSHYSIPKKSKQLSEVEDYKAYTVEERDLIIDSFRSHPKPSVNQISDLIEFLFLTGCRHGEALALTWGRIKLDKGWIIFKESYDSQTNITKGTKTDVDRLFKMQGMTRLINLLKRLYGEGKSNDELVFTTPDGKRLRRTYIQRAWQYNTVVVNGRPYTYNGVVMELAEEGKLQYLKPYSTRHTFISIQANNGADLALLADSCGNSVDVIIEHYLDKDRDSTLKDI